MNTITITNAWTLRAGGLACPACGAEHVWDRRIHSTGGLLQCHQCNTQLVMTVTRHQPGGQMTVTLTRDDAEKWRQLWSS